VPPASAQIVAGSNLNKSGVMCVTESGFGAMHAPDHRTGRGGRAPPAIGRNAMNADKAVNARFDALSDKELNAVSGGKARVQVTKEQYEQILEVRMMFANLK
jgi:bacteriocin-like protein